MKYWVIKGNPRMNDWDSMLVPGARDEWHTGRFPKSVSIDDRLFCWESTPRLQIIGLAEIVNPNAGTDESNNHRLFEVRYLSTRVENPLSIAELRQIPVLETAAFLKSGPAATLFPLTDDQANVIHNLLCSRNQAIASLWGQNDVAQMLIGVPDTDLLSMAEGNKKLATHLTRERNRRLVEMKRHDSLITTGTLSCEACGFNFETYYGSLGAGFCEVHHRRPLSEESSAVQTTINDLAVLCSNCHRMIHRTNPIMLVEEFRETLKKTEGNR